MLIIKKNQKINQISNLMKSTKNNLKNVSNRHTENYDFIKKNSTKINKINSIKLKKS